MSVRPYRYAPMQELATPDGGHGLEGLANEHALAPQETVLLQLAAQLERTGRLCG